MSEQTLRLETKATVQRPTLPETLRAMADEAERMAAEGYTGLWAHSTMQAYKGDYTGGVVGSKEVTGDE